VCPRTMPVPPRPAAALNLRPLPFAFRPVLVKVDDACRRHAGGSDIWPPALRACDGRCPRGSIGPGWLLRRIPKQLVEVPERLRQPLSQMFELTNPLLAVLQQTIDPREHDGPTDALAAPLLDLGGLVVESIGEDKAKGTAGRPASSRALPEKQLVSLGRLP